MRVVLSALVLATLAGCATTPPAASTACPATRNWTAFINAMPGPGAQPSLIVTGEANVPGGMQAVLRPGPTDRMMPPGQRLVLATEPGGGASGWQPVRAEIAPALPTYREVIVTCDGQRVWRIEGAAIETAH
jgi:type IV pilus biogenesis protein CpaD/CtpE